MVIFFVLALPVFDLFCQSRHKNLYENFLRLWLHAVASKESICVCLQFAMRTSRCRSLNYHKSSNEWQCSVWYSDYHYRIFQIKFTWKGVISTVRFTSDKQFCFKRIHWYSTTRLAFISSAHYPNNFAHLQHKGEKTWNQITCRIEPLPFEIQCS